MAQLEQGILGQDSIEGRTSDDQITGKVSIASPSLKHHLAPSTRAATDFERGDNHSGPCTDVKSGALLGYVSREYKTVCS